MKVTDVDVSKLSDSELDDLLKRVDEEDISEESEYPEPEPEVYDEFVDEVAAQSDVESPPATETPVVVEAKNDPDNREPTDKSQQEPVKTESTPIDPYLKSLYDKIEALEKRLTPPPPVAIAQPTVEPMAGPIEPEQFFEKPDEVLEAKLVEIENRRAALREQQIREFNTKTEQTKQVLLSVDPDFEKYVPDMASYLKTQGVEAGLVEAFQQNPYAAQNVPMLRMLSDIAKEKRMRAELEEKRKPTVTQQQPERQTVVRPGAVRSTPDGAHSKHVDMSKYSDEELKVIIEKGRLS